MYFFKWFFKIKLYTDIIIPEKPQKYILEYRITNVKNDDLFQLLKLLNNFSPSKGVSSFFAFPL